jgi:phage protein D
MARLPTTRFTTAGQDLAPNFLISISGKDVSKASSLWDAVRPFVSSVSFEEDEDMMAELEIKLINKSDDTQGATADFDAILNSKAFQEGNYVDLWLGYGSSLEYRGRVEIARWLPTFPANGPITLSVKGMDGRHRMTKSNQFKVRQTGKNRVRKTSYPGGLTDDRIVKKIASKYGYGADTDSVGTKKAGSKSKPVARVQPSDMSDWAFLRKLASINRFDLWVDYDRSRKQYVVHFKQRKDAGAATYKFEYGQGLGSLLEAQPDFSIQDQPTDVEVLYFDRKRRVIERTIISDSTKAETVKLTATGVGNLQVKKEAGKGASVRFTAFGQQIEAFADRPFASKNAATTFVQNWLKEREDDFLLVRGKVIGVETLAPRQIHQLVGMSTRLDGFYRLTQVKHDIQPGQAYICEFLAHKVLSQEVTRRKATTKVQTRAKAQQAG